MQTDSTKKKKKKLPKEQAKPDNFQYSPGIVAESMKSLHPALDSPQSLFPASHNKPFQVLSLSIQPYPPG